MSRTRSQPKPFRQLQALARQLGWRPLCLQQHYIKDDRLLVTWYEGGEYEDPGGYARFQINEFPIGQTKTYEAAVYALRYRIYTGWHPFRLKPDGRCSADDLARLDGWLHRRWFDSLPGRREFRKLHPECSGWSWKRIGQERGPWRPTK